MKLLRIACLLISSTASGAITLLPAPATIWTAPQAPYPSHVVSESETVVSLDERSGLSPGLPIRITLAGGENFLWLIGFCSSEGFLEFSSHATVRLMIGLYSAQAASTIIWNGNFIPPDPNTSCPVAFVAGRTMPPLEVIVPWDTDLSQARFVISQDAIVSGSNARFYSSAIHLYSSRSDGAVIPATVELTSVPEPEPFVMLFLTVALRLRRRRLSPPLPAQAVRSL